MSTRLLPTLLLTLAALTLTAASAQAADSTWRRSAPLNIAHNGGEDEAPSGTMYAFRQAVRAGTDVIDFDLAVTDWSSKGVVISRVRQKAVFEEP